jgi:hypothetical protein
VENPRDVKRTAERRLAEIGQALATAETAMRALSGFEALMGFADETSRAWDWLYTKSDALRVERRELEKVLAEVAHAG